MILGKSLGEKCESLKLPPKPNGSIFRDLRMHMKTCVWYKGLMVAARGYLGLVPAAAELGDMIAFLVGCELPMVFRRHDETGFWKVVGPG